MQADSFGPETIVEDNVKRGVAVRCELADARREPPMEVGVST